MQLSEASYKISQKIWSSTDAILLVFAGSAAEFAAIKAVDWLFFTNRLPSAPIDRLFDTAKFAQYLFFSEQQVATATLETINKIHGSVEKRRGMNIPNWAYKDVLYMLVDYGERAHHVVFGAMTLEEKVAYFEAAMMVGRGLNLSDLPSNYDNYLEERKHQLVSDYEVSDFTVRLFESYKKHLGNFRYQTLKLIQGAILPDVLRSTLQLKSNPVIKVLLKSYHFFPGGGEKLKPLHAFILPKKYRNQLKELGKVEGLKEIRNLPGLNSFT